MDDGTGAGSSLDAHFKALTGHAPLRWQARLYTGHFARGETPAALDVPTGLGKTSVMALWLIARAASARLPRRLVYVVDRRAVVDQATEVAEQLRERLASEDASSLRTALGLTAKQALAISTLRGQFADNRDWQADPAAPAIIIGTVDMIGSRLLFEGYGVSRGMRPFHAGLLGADTLIVLDEAHLVPPFERLLEDIEADAPDIRGRRTYGPIDDADRALIPPLRLMSLSATGGARAGSVFRLSEEDVDETTSKRLGAAKALRFVPSSEGDLATRLAQEAWRVSGEGGLNVRVLVFCDSRETAQKTSAAIEGMAKAARKAARENVEFKPPELFVGARRVKEREDAKKRLEELGYLGGSGPPPTPCFLVATSAGEVGVDIDADHLVCDLVTYDRMVQRFGRVNRRGCRADTEIAVVEGDAPKKDPSDAEKDRRARAEAARALLERLPENNGAYDASPGALMRLKNEVGADAIAAASAALPLRPALNRALVDAWSMTSLKEHTGRPEIAPWLRGWVDDELQTTVVWRTHLPVFADGEPLPRTDIAAFFEAAPVHVNEELQTEQRRVLAWLKDRLKRATAKTKEAALPEVFGVLLSQAGEQKLVLRAQDFAGTDAKAADRAWREFDRGSAESVLVVRAALGGLRDGMLDESADDVVLTADANGDFGVLYSVNLSDEQPSRGSRVAFSRAIASDEGGEPTRWLIVRRGESQDGKSLSKYEQLLDEHQSWAEEHARTIVTGLGLRSDIADAVVLAARLHDEGKKAPVWQRAFNARRDAVYGKTKGPIDQATLDGYRHEFGSLPYATRDDEFQALTPDLKDLVLHLIAAHHGRARPTIETRGCEDAPPIILQDRARDVALRFARLQKRFGPWGLAWLEALVRAADQQASRRLDEEGPDHG